jgi:uncharacterized protein
MSMREQGRSMMRPAGAPALTTELSGTVPPNPAKRQLVEVVVFLSLIAPSMVLSFFATQRGTLDFEIAAWATICRDLALVSLIAYLLWRDGEPMVRLGWHVRNLLAEIALGLGLFFPLLMGTSFLERYLRAIGFSGEPKSLASFLTPQTPEQFALAFLLVLVVAFAEETIFRGYLILRFVSITRSRLAAAVLSAIIFSVGHGYEGAAGVVTVGVMGLVLAAVYLWRRSLVATIVMHFMQDFVAVIAVPLATHHP